MAVAGTFRALLETMKHCGKQQANQAAVDRDGGERFGRKHGGLEASRETQRALDVKSRGFLDWSFAADFWARLALSERDVFKCEKHFGEIMTANMNMCIVLQQLDEGTLKQDVLLNSARLSD